MGWIRSKSWLVILVLVLLVVSVGLAVAGVWMWALLGAVLSVPLSVLSLREDL